MIVKTTNSIYEVQEQRGRFRRIAGEASIGAPTEGVWHTFDYMSRAVADLPVRFFWLKETAGSSARLGVWETSPVVEVLADEPDPAIA